MVLMVLKNANAALAFLLELCVLVALGYWGFQTVQGNRQDRTRSRYASGGCGGVGLVRSAEFNVAAARSLALDPIRSLLRFSRSSSLRRWSARQRVRKRPDGAGACPVLCPLHHLGDGSEEYRVFLLPRKILLRPVCHHNWQGFPFIPWLGRFRFFCAHLLLLLLFA